MRASIEWGRDGAIVTAASTVFIAEPEPSPEKTRSSATVAPAIAMAVVLAIALLWSFWPTLAELAERWTIDPQYSHGFLVPLFAAVILWVRRPAVPGLGEGHGFYGPSREGGDKNRHSQGGPVDPLGLLVLAAALVPRWFTGRMDLGALDAVCLLGVIAGTVLLVGGRSMLRWSWPAILFLGFMIPLPFAIEEWVAIPLRRFATLAATYVLQTLGYPALAEGNIIQIEAIRLGVIEACSGLGMLMTLLALATAMALVVTGPVLDRAILVVSAIPIAVLANVMRITLTGIAYVSLGWQEYHQLIHDVLGWFMMPLALVLLWTEYQFLQRLLIPVKTTEALDVPLSPWLNKARRRD